MASDRKRLDQVLQHIRRIKIRAVIVVLAAVRPCAQELPGTPSSYDKIVDACAQQVAKSMITAKISDYPVIVGSPAEASGGYRIVDRPWQELPEPCKLAILQDAVDWSGITNRDQATILLSEIDPGRITDAQRTRLIDAATDHSSYKEMLREAASRGGGQAEKDKSMER